MLLFFILPFYFVGFIAYNVEFLFVIHIFAFFFGLYVFGSNVIIDFFDNKILFIKNEVLSLFSNYFFGLWYFRVFISFFRIFLFITSVYIFSYFFSIFSTYSSSTTTESINFSYLFDNSTISSVLIDPTNLVSSNLEFYVFLF